ncbi:MAG TPA: hypothetical protein PK141_27515, partial [Polyangiaceae bacterium]|nr:hypothetical protein [Polyangiaceae bacterium]
MGFSDSVWRTPRKAELHHLVGLHEKVRPAMHQSGVGSSKAELDASRREEKRGHDAGHNDDSYGSLGLCGSFVVRWLSHPLKSARRVRGTQHDR